MNRTNAGAPRGLTSATLTGASAPIAWKLQGNQGGEDITDTVRGSENNGGLYGERAGWYLAGYPDGKLVRGHAAGDRLDAGRRLVSHVVRPQRARGHRQPRSASTSTTPRPSSTARRSSSTAGTSATTSTTSGRSTRSCCPTASSSTNGRNTVAIATITNDGSGAGLGKVSLVDLGTVASSLVVPDVASPAYVAPTLALTGALPAQAKVGQTIGGAIASLTVPPDAVGHLAGRDDRLGRRDVVDRAHLAAARSPARTPTPRPMRTR